MTTNAPIDPEEVELRQGSAPLSIQRKRDLLSGRLFTPGGKHREGSTRVEAPEPNGQQVATMLKRLNVWLDGLGVNVNNETLNAITLSDNPLRDLKNHLKRLGVSHKYAEVEEAVVGLHENQWRITFITDVGRVQAGAAAAARGDPGDDDAAQYIQEYSRLTGEGLRPFQAHRLLAEWGWENALVPGSVPQAAISGSGGRGSAIGPRGGSNLILEELAERLAVMTATGEYTGPIEPADLLTVASIEAAFQLLAEDYKGSLSLTAFEQVLSTETGIGKTLTEAEQLAAESFDGRPVFEEVVAPDSRAFMGVHPDFVVRVPPRAPGRLRGTTTRPGLDAGDARTLATSGPRGLEAAGEGRLGFEQDPEYRDNDQYNIFAGLGFEQTVLYQTMLVDAGWLSSEDFAIEQGQPSGGFATWEAMQKAMIAANRTEAETWIEAAQISAATRERNEAAAAGLDREPVPVWTPGTYLSPDPDRLTQIVKTAFRSQLGREPTAREISGLMSSLSAEFRGQFEQQEAIDQAAFEQSIAAQEASLGPIDLETGERTVVPLGEDETFRTVDNPLEQVVGVDPLSSFQELFEARFAEEMARGRQRVTQRDARRDIMGSIFAIDAAVGGGR